mmetsp:Transcript_9145/g.15642  ORF Transcript_9145/g.15642 Transcript_9145/m.15642 type:complete len:420 (+) Transcript_9145:80-1339(+)
MDERLLNGKIVPSDAIPQAAKQVPAGKAKRIERITTERLRAVLIHFVVGYHVVNISDLYRSTSTDKIWWDFFNVLIGYSNWPMQVFIVIAGYAAFYNLRSRGCSGYVKERLARLLLPFLFGMIAWNWLSIWLYWEVVGVDYGGTFLGFVTLLKTYIFNCFGGDSSYCLPYYFTLNMWFMVELLTFSMLCLPLFIIWQRCKPPTLSVAQANWIVGVSALAVFPVLTYGLDVFWWFLPDVGNGSEGNNFILYLMFFQCGFAMAWVRELYEAAPRIRWYGFAVVVVSGYILGYIVLRLNMSTFYEYFLLFDLWWEVLVFEIFRVSAMVAAWGFASILMSVPSILANYLDFVSHRVIAIYMLNFSVRLGVFILCDRFIFALYEFDSFLYFLVEFTLTFGITILLFDLVFNHKYIHGLVGMWRL